MRFKSQILKRIVLVCLLASVFCLLPFTSGCTSQQAQQFRADMNDTAKLRLVIRETISELEKNKADTNIPDEQKAFNAVNIIGSKAVEVGLIPPEQANPFLTGLQMAFDAYLATTPLGAGKIDWLTLLILGYVAWKNKKPQ